MSDIAVPVHVGIILDGNRRWAKAKGLPALEGHRQGSEVFHDISLAVFDRGVKYLSAFVFSSENWSRTKEEVGYLMQLVFKAVEKYLDQFNEAGIKIVVLGQRDRLSPKVLAAIERTEIKTAANKRGVLALCFNYGGQQEIVDAAIKLAASGKQSASVTPETFRKYLYHPEIPPIDLLVRTSGEQRLSGFMLYRAAYAELYFTDKFWPDFTVDDLDVALATYGQRQRRFGT